MVALLFVLASCGRGEPEKSLDATGTTFPSDESTTSTSIESTTTSAPATTVSVTAPPTTAAPQRFTVKSVTLTTETCFDSGVAHGGSGATNECRGHWVITFNPGLGGQLKWKLSTAAHLYCREPERFPFNDRETGTVNVTTGMTQAAGDLVWYSEDMPQPKLVDGVEGKDPSLAKFEIIEGGTGSATTPYYGTYDC